MNTALSIDTFEIKVAELEKKNQEALYLIALAAQTLAHTKNLIPEYTGKGEFARDDIENTLKPLGDYLKENFTSYDLKTQPDEIWDGPVWKVYCACGNWFLSPRPSKPSDANKRCVECWKKLCP